MQFKYTKLYYIVCMDALFNRLGVVCVKSDTPISRSKLITQAYKEFPQTITFKL